MYFTLQVCGHRWRNKKFSNYYLANGACYVMDAELNVASIKRLLPLVTYTEQFPQDERGSLAYGNAYGQAGISAALCKKDEVST